MGMFDRITNTYYKLGPQFYKTRLQTKDLDCLMNHYWISPAGELYYIDDSKTVDLVDNPAYKEDDINVLRKGWVSPYIYVPNGNHGKVSPCYITKTVRVYPEQWDGEYDDWPDRILIFRFGVIEYVVNPKLENKRGCVC